MIERLQTQIESISEMAEKLAERVEDIREAVEDLKQAVYSFKLDDDQMEELEEIFDRLETLLSGAEIE
jgi:methyl-accepting chemotaxis protein